MKKYLALLCFGFNSLLISSPASSSDYAVDNTGPRMAEAMWDMMDWMKSDTNDSLMPFNFGSTGMPGMSRFPGMMGMPGMDPFSFDSMPMMNQFGVDGDNNPMTQMERFMPGQWGRSDDADGFSDGATDTSKWPASHRLDGVWKGQSGEFFMIKGKSFRLASTSGQSLDGRISIIGDRMQTYVPVTEQVRQYQFVKIGEMMMMRDETGQTLIFNRLHR